MPRHQCQEENFTTRFGEEFDGENGEGADMDDNVRNSKTKIEAQDQVVHY
jgi:hypothetical protein